MKFQKGDKEGIDNHIFNQNIIRLLLKCYIILENENFMIKCFMFRFQLQIYSIQKNVGVGDVMQQTLLTVGGAKLLTLLSDGGGLLTLLR